MARWPAASTTPIASTCRDPDGPPISTSSMRQPPSRSAISSRLYGHQLSGPPSGWISIQRWSSGPCKPVRRPTIGGRAGTRAPFAGLTIWTASGPRRGSGVAVGGSAARVGVTVADGRGVTLGSTSATGEDAAGGVTGESATPGVRLADGVEPAVTVAPPTPVAPGGWVTAGSVTVTIEPGVGVRPELDRMDDLDPGQRPVAR